MGKGTNAARAAGAGVDFFRGDEVLYRVGKKASGRVLDGRTHDGFPEVGHA